MNSSSVNLFKYDIAISYTSEQYVTRVVNILEMEGLRVFFTLKREEELLAADLITKFNKIYQYESPFVVGFISEDYLGKFFAIHEAKTALLCEKDENRNCFIPVYFQNVKLLKG